MNTVNQQALKSLRKLHNKTQEDLATELGISRQSYIAREKTGEFNAEEIEKLANFFDIKKEELYREKAVELNDLYQLIAENSIRQDSMLRALLSAVSELVAQKRGITVDEMNRRILKSVNSQSTQRLDQL